MKGIPKSGLIGTALREAVTEWKAIIEAVREALRAKLAGPTNADPWVCIEAIWPDRVVMEWQGKYWQYSYSMDDAGAVTLGEPQAVVEEYRPVASSATMIEAVVSAQAEPTGTVWLVRVIQSGLSKNNYEYPASVLREATPLFDGVRVMEKPDVVHLAGGGKDTRNIIGQLRNARFVETAPDAGEVRAELHLLEASGLPPKFLEMYRRGMSDLFGFSIDARGFDRPKGTFREATSIKKVLSVDLIVEPGAGGQLINLIEAVQEPDSMRVRMIEAIKAKHGGTLPANLNTDDDAALETAYREAIAPAPASGADTAALAEQIRMVEARSFARATIAASTLPAPAKDKLLADFGARATFREADVTAAIEGERAYLARFTEAGHVTGLGDGRLEVGDDFADKCGKMLDDFFAAKPGGPTSFKECYAEITGDRRVTGRLQDCNPVRLREATGALPAQFREAVSSGTFSLILGDGIHRRMIADYRQPNQYDIWRPLVGTPVPITDFRTNERTRMGGFGDVPKVAERGSYDELSTPSDEQAEYAVEKRGGIISISLETIRNDDVGAIRRLPISGSRACKRTLAKFVLDFIRLNPTIYDGKALFHADHNNLGAAALSANAYAAARLAMLKQAELDTNEPLGIAPKYLWVAYDGEEGAADLFKRDTNLDETFVQSLKPTIVPVWYWTDADDWAATADPNDCPFIELGFLDGNEEPEMFVQDSPTVGSLFANDTITYKLRHIYGGNVLDYRGAYKAVVA
jgi:hypothetical protein